MTTSTPNYGHIPQVPLPQDHWYGHNAPDDKHLVIAIPLDTAILSTSVHAIAVTWKV